MVACPFGFPFNQPRIECVFFCGVQLLESDEPATRDEPFKFMCFEFCVFFLGVAQLIRGPVKIWVWGQDVPPTNFTSSLPACQGVLLYGPPGTGKTLTARAVANRPGLGFRVGRSLPMGFDFPRIRSPVFFCLCGVPFVFH